MNDRIEAVKTALINELTTNGNGDKARRLVLELQDGRDGGGYYISAIETIIDRALARLAAEPEPCEGHDGINNCLHCGGRAEIVHGMQDGWIACSKCGAAGPRRSSDEDAIAAWNRFYASQVADKRAEELRNKGEVCELVAGEYREKDCLVKLRIDRPVGCEVKIGALYYLYRSSDLDSAIAATEPKP